MPKSRTTIAAAPRTHRGRLGFGVREHSFDTAMAHFRCVTKLSARGPGRPSKARQMFSRLMFNSSLRRVAPKALKSDGEADIVRHLVMIEIKMARNRTKAFSGGMTVMAIQMVTAN